MGGVTKAMENNKTAIRRGRTEIHRDQAIVERFNRTLAERLFGNQYAVEMNLPSGRSTAWVKRLPEVVSALNNEVTRLTGKITCTSNQRESRLFKTRYAIYAASGDPRKETTATSTCEVLVLPRGAGRGRETRNRPHLIFESLHNPEGCYQAGGARGVLSV